MSRKFLFLAFGLLPASAISADAGAIGRLFHSPEERRALDQLRQDEGRNSQAPDNVVEAQQFRLDGIVKRSNGKSTSWINGVAYADHQTVQGLKVLPPPGQRGTAAIQLAPGKNINLKAGQTYDANSGQVQEGYGMPVTTAQVIHPVQDKAAPAKATARTVRPAAKP